MKKYIKTLDFTDYHAKEQMRKHLNGLGFYCLSFGDTSLEVYAIERIIPFEVRAIEWLSLMVKALKLHLQIGAYKN